MLSLDTEPTVLDLQKHAVMEALVGKANFVDLLRRFHQTLATEVAAIASDRTCPSQKSEHAHRLAGVSGTLGFAEVFEQSMHLQNAHKRKVDDLGPFIEKITAAAARANAVLEDLHGF